MITRRAGVAARGCHGLHTTVIDERMIRISRILGGGLRSLTSYALRTGGRLRAGFADADHLVATKVGLFALADRRPLLLREGNFYGLTRDGDSLLAFEAFPRIGRGRVLRLDPAGTWSVAVPGLPWGCHQIDVIDGGLWVLDTHHNAVRRFGLDGRPRDVAYPLGRLGRGRRSPNYGHMNSLWSDGSRVYILCHNETAKTGRRSEILVCGSGLAVERVLPTEAGSAHNLALWRGQPLLCDSLGERLLHGGRALSRIPGFLRGLSIGPAEILVGQSSYGPRSAREALPGGITAIDHDGAIRWQLPLPGQVQEIRGWRAPDAGLSRAR